MSAKIKVSFAPLPIRAVGDPRLSTLHFRVLAIVAHRDRMSLVTGKGQGCWASSQHMADEIGANITNVSTAINQLAKWGYIVIDALQSDKRKRTYRVIFEADEAWDHLPVGKEDDADDLPTGKGDSEYSLPQGQTISVDQSNPIIPVDPDRLPKSDRSEKVVCPVGDQNPQKTAKNSPQYIPQSGEKYSAEAWKRYSAEASRHAAGVLGDKRAFERFGDRIDRIERGFAQKPYSIDLRDLRWLGDIATGFAQIDPTISVRAKRLETAMAANLDGPPAESRTCEHCGDQFEVSRPERGASPRRFCGEPCRKKAERVRQYARQRAGVSIGSLVGDAVHNAMHPRNPTHADLAAIAAEIGLNMEETQ